MKILPDVIYRVCMFELPYYPYNIGDADQYHNFGVGITYGNTKGNGFGSGDAFYKLDCINNYPFNVFIS